MGRVYLIVGASSDLGIALLKNTKWKPDDIVFVQYNHSFDKIVKLKEYVCCQLEPVQADFLSMESTERFVEQIKGFDKTLTHIVHIPSVPIENKRFVEFVWDDYENYFNVQIRSIVEALRAFLPAMAKKKYGKIVFIMTSGVLNIPPKFLSAYITSKYALLGLMKSIAIEYAGKHINVNAVSPSMMETNFLCNINEKVVEGSAINNPMGRNARVQDVVPIIQYLLSDEAEYVTGTNIPVTGGENF